MKKSFLRGVLSLLIGEVIRDADVVHAPRLRTRNVRTPLGVKSELGFP